MELRNLPAPRILDYLNEAGGTLDEGGRVTGTDWTATLIPLPPAQVSIVTVPRDLLVIEGVPDAVERLYGYMRRKTMRGGG
jgi:hypothetical protein